VITYCEISRLGSSAAAGTAAHTRATARAARQTC
jgi:hypothetical protein